MKDNISIENNTTLAPSISEINRQKRELIAKKWLLAIKSNKIDEILPTNKDELNFYDVWWYNFALVEKFLQQNESSDDCKNQVILGYYGEPFAIENWFIQQTELIAQGKLDKDQVQVIIEKEKEMQDVITVNSPTVHKWLQAISNGTVKEILPKEKSDLKFENLWWYNYSLVYFCYFQAKKSFLGRGTIITDYYGQKVEIGKWLQNQVKAGLNNGLQKSQIEALKKMDIILDENCDDYQKVIYRHACLRWIKVVQAGSVKEILPSKLEDLSRYEIWGYKYAVAYKYFEEFKNLDLTVSSCVTGYYGETVDLGIWVREQRQKLHRNNILPEQQKALDDIHMIWRKDLVPKGRWELNLKAAKQYKEENRSLAIPVDYNVTTEEGVSLSPGRWIRNQKQKRSIGRLNDSRENELTELGVDWNMRDTQWQESYQCASKYFKENHHLHVTINSKTPKDSDIRKLHSWIARQRKEYLEGNLAPARTNLLDKIGMIWNRKENYSNNLLLFEYYGLSNYCNREILDSRSNLIMNAMISYCKDKELPLAIGNEINPVIINCALPKNESLTIGDLIEEYQYRLALFRKNR